MARLSQLPVSTQFFRCVICGKQTTLANAESGKTRDGLLACAGCGGPLEACSIDCEVPTKDPNAPVPGEGA